MARFPAFILRVPCLAAAVLLAGFLTLPAQAAQDEVQFGNTIAVGPTESIHDAVCFFCSVHVKGTVNGDIVAFFGDVFIDGHAKHDVVNFFGDVRAGDNSSIGHDVVNFFGGVRLGQNATVGRDTVVMFGNLRASDSASFGGSRVVEPGWIFWMPFLAICFGVFYVVHEIRENHRRRIYSGF